MEAQGLADRAYIFLSHEVLKRMRSSKSQRQRLTGRATEMPDKRLLTVVMTDVVGSTQHAVEGGETEFLSLMKAFMESANSAIHSSGGMLQKFLGDGCMAIFPTPRQAVDFAIAFQKRVQELNIHHRLSRGLQIRIGIATGEALALDQDVVGTVVNVASRLCSISRSREIVMDQATATLLDDERRGRVSNLGEWEIKGLGRRRLYSYKVKENK